MSVTRKGNSITMTAAADAYTGIVSIAGLTFQVTGGSAGDRLLVKDESGGSIIADYIVTAATDNADLWGGRDPKFYAAGVYLDTCPSGTAVLTVVTE